MSENKKGVSIREDDESIQILANDGFSESKKCIEEILNVLNEKKNKRLRLSLSSKGKSFPNVFSKIRRTIIDKEWKNAEVRIKKRSHFKQTIEADGYKKIHTPSYVAIKQEDGLTIGMSSQRTIFADDPYAKELAYIIGLEQPKYLDIYFSRSIAEKKPEDFQNRIRSLQNFFVRYLKDIYSIEDVAFYKGSEKNLIACYVRYPDNDVLFEVDLEAAQASEDVPPVLPVFKTKHVCPEMKEIIEDEKENKKK